MTLIEQFEIEADVDINEAETVAEAYYAGANAVVSYIESLHEHSISIEEFFSDLHEFCNYISETYGS